MAIIEEFTVEHSDGTVFGKIAYPEGEGPWPTVIFSHGFSACRPYDTGMERDFVERGFAFIAFDFRNGMPGSRSSGTSREMSVLTEVKDLEAVLDWAQAQRAVDSKRVFLLGSSQGGYVSTYVASERSQDVSALGLFFPAFNIADDAQARVDDNGGFIPDEVQIGPLVIGRRYNEDALAVDIYDRMGSYEGDVLIVHGALDDIVPVEYSRRATQAFRGSCRLQVIDELGHGFRTCPPAISERAFGMAADFFADHA